MTLSSSPCGITSPIQTWKESGNANMRWTDSSLSRHEPGYWWCQASVHVHEGSTADTWVTPATRQPEKGRHPLYLDQVLFKNCAPPVQEIIRFLNQIRKSPPVLQCQLMGAHYPCKRFVCLAVKVRLRVCPNPVSVVTDRLSTRVSRVTPHS